MNPSAERTLKRFLRAPLVKWDDIASKTDPLILSEVSSAADSDAERLATLASYTAARYRGNTHETARKFANKRTVKVRRALGYSYPESGISTSW
jgi:hypothetical protein